jgi:hypothetical protein
MERVGYDGADWWRGVHLMRAALYRARFYKMTWRKRCLGTVCGEKELRKNRVTFSFEGEVVMGK